MVSKSLRAMNKKNKKSNSITMKNTDKNHLDQEEANQEAVEEDEVEKMFILLQSKKHTQEPKREKNSLLKTNIAIEAEEEEVVCTEDEETEAEAIEVDEEKEEEAEVDLLIDIIKRMRKETGEETIKKKLKKHRITSSAMKGMSDEAEEEEEVSEVEEEEVVILMKTQEVIRNLLKNLFTQVKFHKRFPLRLFTLKIMIKSKIKSENRKSQKYMKRKISQM